MQNSTRSSDQPDVVDEQRITINDSWTLKNPYSNLVTLDKLRHYLQATKQSLALELLEKAISKAKVDKAYFERMENAFLRGSTVEYRELFADFGNYWARTSNEAPFYPHAESVDGIDSAMLHIKVGDEQEAIDDYNFIHNRS